MSTTIKGNDMTDKIIYLITDNGVDGRAQTSVIFASYDEQERDATYDISRNKAWYNKAKRIVEVERETKQALAKLDGVGRLLLDIEQKEIK
jgi:hypothetical protein